MKKVHIILAAWLADSVYGGWNTDKMAFAYLQSRHGARAPTDDGETM